MTLKVLLARHGTSLPYENIDADKDIVRQSKFTPLGPRGILQAQLLGKKIATLKPDVLLNSPYRRAAETAEIIARFAPLCPNAIDDLREIRRIVDGHSVYSQLNLDYKKWRGEAIKRGDMVGKFHPHDQSFGEYLAQILRVKHWLPKEFDNQTVLIVGHSQFSSMFISSALLGDKPSPSSLFTYFNRYFMTHAALTTLEYHYRHGWKVIDFNNTSHLK